MVGNLSIKRILGIEIGELMPRVRAMKKTRKIIIGHALRGMEIMPNNAKTNAILPTKNEHRSGISPYPSISASWTVGLIYW